jgi:hypothetical protein
MSLLKTKYRSQEAVERKNSGSFRRFMRFSPRLERRRSNHCRRLLHVHLLLVGFGCLAVALSGCSAPIQTSTQGASLMASPGAVSFGTVPLGQTASSNVSLVNQGSDAVTVSSVSVAGQSFSISETSGLPMTVPAGSAYALNINFSPAATGAATGQLMITTNSEANPTLSVSLNGTGTATAASAPTLSSLSCMSGSMTVAGTDSCTLTLTSAAASGGFTASLTSNSSAVTLPVSMTVPAGATSASFTATVSSVITPQTATLTASAGGAAETFVLQLGVSVHTLSINASSMSFGNVDLNSPATQSLTLTWPGTSSVTLSGATVTGAGFSVSGASFPLTLSPNQTSTLSVQFDPTAAGAVSGSLTITSSTTSVGTVVIALSGTGVASSYEVNLNWEAPTNSTDTIAGYNVFRSPSGGSSYAQLNSSVVTQTTYVDGAVQNGQTYDYIVESVDASGAESVPSNTAAVTIP